MPSMPQTPATLILLTVSLELMTLNSSYQWDLGGGGGWDGHLVDKTLAVQAEGLCADGQCP